MRYVRYVLLGLVVAGLGWGGLGQAATAVGVGAGVGVVKTAPSTTTPSPTPLPTDWKQWCAGQLAAARASQVGYVNWRDSLGIPTEAAPVPAPVAGMTAATAQALGTQHQWPTPAPQQSVHDLVVALAQQVGIYVVLPDPTLTFDAEHNIYIVCPEGTVYNAQDSVPTPK